MPVQKHGEPKEKYEIMRIGDARTECVCADPRIDPNPVGLPTFLLVLNPVSRDHCALYPKTIHFSSSRVESLRQTTSPSLHPSVERASVERGWKFRLVATLVPPEFSPAPFSCNSLLSRYSHFLDSGEELVIRSCAPDSGTLTIDTELVRMSHCGSFIFDERYVKGCLQSCDNADGCNFGAQTNQPQSWTSLFLLLFAMKGAAYSVLPL
ncbi:unnamed protein product [Darwinula stevensoni]|uniref:Uncharacterized protein n=1 Tax=Darwinula stevensoni TaxID=69355 RepID=A0A7R8X5T0_9CRUS|nr:unnamed protein product [Darwinula stevensoni]CAG0886978.1 unnamed protein product [Darwinula stevensoni]